MALNVVDSFKIKHFSKIFISVFIVLIAFATLCFFCYQSDNKKKHGEHRILSRRLSSINRQLKDYFKNCGEYPNYKKKVNAISSCDAIRFFDSNLNIKNEFGYMFLYESDGKTYRLEDQGNIFIYKITNEKNSAEIIRK